MYHILSADSRAFVKFLFCNTANYRQFVLRECAVPGENIAASFWKSLDQSAALTFSVTVFMLLVGSKRATSLPSRSTRNFVKFHLMELLFL